MCAGKIFVIYLLFIVGANGLQHVESELSRLPKLFHLDDYQQCLDQEGGVYCLGQFQIYSDTERNPTFDLIQKYSSDSTLYNRSYLHRGYCVSTRCAGADTNTSARFEECVDKWARHRYQLRARLFALHYCKEHGKPLPYAPDTKDTSHRVFLYVVLTLLALNIIGTIYDLNFETCGKRNSSLDNEMLRSWSLRQNWERLTATPPSSADTRMDSLNGVKALMSLTPMYCHASILMTAMYLRNPRYIEKYLGTPAGPMMGAFTTFTQAHLIISNFITVYGILVTPNVTMKLLPALLLKRLIRMLPVYLIGVGFAATWWSSMGDGPLWYLVETESAVCRQKFWMMTSFLQNVVDPKNICLVQTWIMAVDMQVHIPVVLVTLLLKNRPRLVWPVLSALFVAAVGVTAHIALENSYVPAYLYMTPDAYRVFFSTIKSFTEFFIAPTNCLISAVTAVGLGFFHKSLQERRVKLQERKSLVVLSYLGLLAIFSWAYYCHQLRKMTEPWFDAAMVPTERVVYSVILSLNFILFVNIDTKLIKFLRWENFRPISRMSLGISMVHWSIIGILLFNHQTLLHSSIAFLVTNTLATYLFSISVALLLTLMVELPMKKTLERMI